MTWRDEWKAIAARIDGLLDAGRFFVGTLQVSSEDGYGVATHLSNQAQDIIRAILNLSKANEASFPAPALNAIRAFLVRFEKPISDSSVSGLSGLKLRLTSLSSLRAEVEYHLTDFAAVTRRRSERAFEHLQQSIVADDSIRGRWQAAFERGELACERLGGAHLLLHGIWAFKVMGPGARTDLVFGDQLTDLTRIERAADALVLTEWKLVREPAKVDELAASARAQADLYAGGLLGGLELAQVRYVVLVSRSRIINPPPDASTGVVTYRHITISVDPETPSQLA